MSFKQASKLLVVLSIYPCRDARIPIFLHRPSYHANADAKFKELDPDPSPDPP